MVLNPFSWFRSEPKAKAPLYLHNTLSGNLEEFTSLSDGPVRMYNCGPTVYDFVHIGNLRSYVFADLLRRTLTLSGHRVKQVINITDVGHLTSDADEGEDKMEKGAKARGSSVEALVAEITESFFADLDLLSIPRESINFPRATEYIGEQIALIQTLEEKGYTYTIKDGVYFDTSKFKEYGKLGHIDVAHQKEGARIGITEDKRNPADFALWKFSTEGEQRLQEWKSPWGVGFPGWHIECTAMIFKLLGKQIDIHTGGIDHVPVHHNNEIAQAEGATGKQYVRYWLHNAFITIEGKKVSKSLGNTISLRSIVERGFSPLAYRYLLLTAHYRSPFNFTWTALEAAQQTLMRMYRIFFDELPKTGMPSQAFVDRFSELLNQDLDTPKALAYVWEMLKDNTIPPHEKRGNLLYADRAFGLGLSSGVKRMKEMVSLKVLKTEDLPEAIQEKVAAREEARKNKDFATADLLRSQITEAGYDLSDGPDGPSIRKI